MPWYRLEYTQPAGYTQSHRFFAKRRSSAVNHWREFCSRPAAARLRAIRLLDVRDQVLAGPPSPAPRIAVEQPRLPLFRPLRRQP